MNVLSFKALCIEKYSGYIGEPSNIEGHHINEEQAMDAFYRSGIGETFSDDETRRYGQSHLYTFGLNCEERLYKGECTPD